MDKDYNFTIGELVFTVRKLSKLTQVEFSKKLGVVQSTVSKVEKDIFDDVPFSLISKISTDFDIPLQHFQFGHLPSKKNNDAKAIIPSQYLDDGIFKARTLYSVLKEVEKTHGDKIFKELKLPQQYLSLSSIKYGYEFINKLYSLVGEELLTSLEAIKIDQEDNKMDSVIISKYLQSLPGVELLSATSEIKTGAHISLGLNNHLSELNKVYAKFFEVELSLLFNTNVTFNIEKTKIPEAVL